MQTLSKRRGLVDMVKEYFKIQCMYCKINYEYKLYDDGKLIKKSEKDFGELEAKISHGICKECVKKEV